MELRNPQAPPKIQATCPIERREAIRSAIRAAHGLAIADQSAQAMRTLGQLETSAIAGDSELQAMYLQAFAVAKVKAGSLEEAFVNFDDALHISRKLNDSSLLLQVLNNYGTSLLYVGDIDRGIEYFEEALTRQRSEGNPTPSGLAGLAEALFGAGRLERAAARLHEFFSLEYVVNPMAQCDVPRALFVASATGIPVSTLMDDGSLHRLSCNTALLDLAFARPEQWILGPLVEAHCALYEHEGRRGEHDALLVRAIAAMPSLDNSFELAVRIARLGPADELPRVSNLMRRQCLGGSPLLRAYEFLFESFIARRRSMNGRAETLALNAATELERISRPLKHAFALEAAGLVEDAQTIRARCGARINSLSPKWIGLSIPQRLAERLTEREMEVARLAAQGLSNRSVAGALKLSQRTVQHHCEAIFGKLGIHSRWQLSAVLPSVIEGHRTN